MTQQLARNKRRARAERGSAGVLLTAGALIAVAGVFALTMLVIGWFACIRAAEQAAELAALAGVSASVKGADPCSAAETTAARNDARVSRCEVRGGGRNVVVEVSVRTQLTPRVIAVPETVEHSATAGT